MSCEVRNNAVIESLDEIQAFFGLSGIQDKTWLNGVFISTLLDSLVFGYGSKLAIMSSRHDKEKQKVFDSKSLKKIQLTNENDIVTSILSYPIVGGANYVDWTCIIVGLSSGGIQFFSDNGALLYAKQLQTEPVLHIKSYLNEEISVSFPSCIIVFQTMHLISLLKTFKEMNSRTKATKVDLLDKDSMLVFKKWDYKNREFNVSDTLVIPQQKSCYFDHLLLESLEMGFTKKYRVTPHNFASVITTGTKYISFYSAREGFKQNVFTDVAKAVVNKLTSRLPGWLTGSQQTQSTDKPDNLENVTETMYPRYELLDYQRMGCNIWMSPPHYQLAAVSDTLGRIVLLDIATGITIRMWKGYRDAQCGFIEVNEDRNKKETKSETRRTGLFLIIFAPRKAIVEIWCMQKGPKVATFQFSSKNGFLIYNGLIPNDANSHMKSKQQKGCCLFLDANDNCLKEFHIPFHCILSESNSKSAEDFHYLKRLKMTLKNVNLKDLSTHEGILELCQKLQTPEIRIKCLELLTSYKKTEPNLILAVIDLFLRCIEKESVECGNSHQDNYEGEMQQKLYQHQLLACCENLKSLVTCYLMVNDKMDDGDELSTKASESIELIESEYIIIQRIVELMNINKKELTINRKNVSFKDRNEENINTFLGSFIVSNKDAIFLNTEHHENVYITVGSALFANVWNDILPTQKLLEIFQHCRISSEEIMRCFLHFWLQQELNFTNEDFVLTEMTKFKNVLDQVCKYGGDKNAYAYNSICTFWQDVREYLLESNNPINSLLAAIICKNHALKQQDENQDEMSFEQVTQEECQWILLTEKLNDVAVLSIFVSHFGNNHGQKKYTVPNISLKKILNDGKGIVSELVAAWLIGVNVNIKLIFKETCDNDELDETAKSVIRKLEVLRQHFPYSLNPPVILCHVIWNLMCHWSKNLTEVQFLKSSMEYLGLFSEENYNLKHGLCLLLWNANFKIPLKATQKLINKTGRLPKEKLCLQNTGIPDFLMPQFLEQTLLFLDHFKSSIEYQKAEFKCEEILNQGSNDQACLIETVLTQIRGNMTVIKLHCEMVSVLELIAFLNIKYTKPMQSLFDDVSNDAFFTDINKQLPYSLQKADEIRQNTRVYFLKKAISTTIDLIIECQQSTYYADHLKWIEKIKKIGAIWDLNLTLIERHHIVELYVYGYDDLADELIEEVSEREKIVKILLDIAAKRLNLHLETNRANWKFVASGGSLLTNYLESIQTRKDDTILENVRPSSLDRLYKLTYKIFQIASLKNFSDSRALRLAGQLLDVSLLLKDSEEN